MNTGNLIKLSKFILKNIKDEQFSMKWFRSNHTDNGVEFYTKEYCGTVGCALGWAPFVPGLEAIGSDWGDVWAFLFDGSWLKEDNTRGGFIKRVIYFLEGGKDLSITKNHPYRKINENIQISFSDVDGCIKIDYSFIVNNIEVDLTSDDLKDLNKTMSHYEDIELVALSKTVKIKIL